MLRIDRLVVVAALAVALVGPARAEMGSCGIVHKALQVSGRNDEWTAADVKIKPGDRVLVVASGKVKVGGFLGAVSADGNGAPHNNDGPGRLEMKVGTGTVISVGKRWFGDAEEAGAVKFRVRDSDYSDNGGAFDVEIIVIPPSAIPQAIKVAAD